MADPAAATPAARPAPPRAALIALAALVALFWCWHGLRLEYPYIFADETVFLTHARATHTSDTPVREALQSPAPLHSALYATTIGSGRNHLAHIRLLNALFCGLAVFPVAALARRFVPAWGALLVAALVGFNPWNTYSGNAMPEALYGFIFWCLAWATVGLGPERTARPAQALGRAALIGGLAAALFLTKSHALTLIGVVVVALVLRAWRLRRAGLVDGWSAVALPLLVFAVVAGTLALVAAAGERTLVDLLYAGRYRGEASGLFSVADPLVTLRVLARQLGGTGAHLAIVYAAPLALACVALPLLWRRPTAGTAAVADLLTFTVLALGATVFFSARFIDGLVQQGHGDMEFRLIERYHGHLAPLLALLFLALHATWRDRPAARVAAVIIGLGTALVLSRQWVVYSFLAYDLPSYYWLNPIAHEPRVLPGWIIAAVLSCAAAHATLLALGRHRHGAWLLLAAAPACVAAIAGAQPQLRRESRGLAPLHEYAAMAGPLIGHAWADTAIVGDAFRTAAFQATLGPGGLGQVPARHVRIAPEGVPVRFASLPEGTRWLIRLNTPEPADAPAGQVVFRGWAHGTFEIVRLDGR